MYKNIKLINFWVILLNFTLLTNCNKSEEKVAPDIFTITAYGAVMIKDNVRNSVTTATIPDMILGRPVISIARSGFAYCEKLTSVTIPNSVTSIEDLAFQYCEELTSIEIPDSVTSIGSEVFNGCSSLTTITVPTRAKAVAWSAKLTKGNSASIYYYY